VADAELALERVGVAGAGTMGAGIAQVSCLGGFDTYLHDPSPDALRSGEERLRAALAKGAERGLWSEAEAEEAARRTHPCEALEDLAPCQLVIEAAPEDLELKRALFGRLAEICGDETILATNTSSLSVTAVADGVPRPERVCGMHFFNPPALMKLVEVVPGDATAEDVVSALRRVGKRMGRTAVRAADEIGFIANRVARPYGLEALRLLGDRIATHEQIDRICRIGGGFRMGPFELMDLVGVDVGFEVSKSFWEQSFHEPRWQPHPIQAKMVAAGRFGRKAGRGYYDYRGGPHRADDPEPPPPSVDPAGMNDGMVLDGDGFRAIPLGSASLAAQAGDDPPAVGFFALAPLADAPLVELTRSSRTSDDAARAAETFFRGCGKHTEWVGEAPGLVLGRIVSQLVNEAAFALQRGIGTAEDIDTAMRLGFNYPRGPLEWGAAIGYDRVLAVLDALRRELGEERYRAAPLLRRMAAEGWVLGAGAPAAGSTSAG
jgi:3-hydroxybutyryl-CoA dehydrogenase